MNSLQLRSYAENDHITQSLNESITSPDFLGWLTCEISWLFTEADGGRIDGGQRADGGRTDGGRADGRRPPGGPRADARRTAGGWMTDAGRAASRWTADGGWRADGLKREIMQICCFLCSLGVGPS